MVDEKRKMIRAREIIDTISEGYDPISGEEIDYSSFLHDPRMIRCLQYISEVLSENISGETIKAKPQEVDFYITDIEAKRITFPEGELGISSICAKINEQIELGARKKLTAVKVNNQLKKMGILATEQDSHGKNKTIATPKANKYGIKHVMIKFGELEYPKVVYDEVGKQFLLVKLQEILDYKSE